MINAAEAVKLTMENDGFKAELQRVMSEIRQNAESGGSDMELEVNRYRASGIKAALQELGFNVYVLDSEVSGDGRKVLEISW